MDKTQTYKWLHQEFHASCEHRLIFQFMNNNPDVVEPTHPEGKEQKEQAREPESKDKSKNAEVLEKRMQALLKGGEERMKKSNEVEEKAKKELVQAKLTAERIGKQEGIGTAIDQVQNEFIVDMGDAAEGTVKEMVLEDPGKDIGKSIEENEKAATKTSVTLETPDAPAKMKTAEVEGKQEKPIKTEKTEVPESNEKGQ